MKFTHILSLGLILFMSIFLVSYAFQHDVVFIDGESILYVVIITLTLIILLMKADRFSVAILVVLVIYTFFRYLLGAFNLFLLSIYKEDVWMYSVYSWARVEDTNLWLRYAFVCTILVGTGLIIGGKISFNGMNSDNKFREKQIRIPAKHLLMIYILFTTVRLIDFYKFGYGAISGHQGSPLYTLYGLINIDVLIFILLVMVITRWCVSSQTDKRIFIFIIIAYVALKVLSGSRSSLYFIFLYFIYFILTFRGDYVVRYKIMLFVIGLVMLGTLLYPISKAFKNIVQYSYGSTISYTYIKEGFSLSDTLTDFMEHRTASFLEIVDRLATMTGQLKIITGQQVIPVEEHINLINIFKRTINDLVPGDVFTDLIPTQTVYATVYGGESPKDVIYGGEFYSLYGVCYVLFGYGGALLVLFLTATMIGYLWKRLYVSHTSLKLIFLGLYIITFDDLLNNMLIEGWLTENVFKRLLSFLLIVLILRAIRSITEAFLYVNRVVTGVAKNKQVHPIGLS